MLSVSDSALIPLMKLKIGNKVLFVVVVSDSSTLPTAAC